MTLQMAAIKKHKIKKKVEVLYIPPDMLDEYWMLCQFMLREGLKYDGDPMSIDDLKAEIKSGNYLFVAISACLVISSVTKF